VVGFGPEDAEQRDELRMLQGIATHRGVAGLTEAARK
jgi:hypothetical protein